MHYARLSLVMFEEGDLRSYGSFAVVSAELYAVNDNIHFNNKISSTSSRLQTVSEVIVMQPARFILKHIN